MFWSAKKRARKIDELAAACYYSKDSPEGGIELSFFPWTPIARDFFKTYGTTDHGFKGFTEPRMFAGYIRYHDSQEFIAVIFQSREGGIGSSFWPPEDYGQDIGSLFKKKLFFDEIIAQLQNRYRE